MIHTHIYIYIIKIFLILCKSYISSYLLRTQLYVLCIHIQNNLIYS